MFKILHGIPILVSLVPEPPETADMYLASSKMQRKDFQDLAYGNYCI